MAKLKYEVVATVGTYTKNGEEKKRYQRIGSVFQGDKGFSIKLDCLPLGPDWNGWASLFEPKDQGRDVPASEAMRRSAPASRPPVDDGDEIPF